MALVLAGAAAQAQEAGGTGAASRPDGNPPGSAATAGAVAPDRTLPPDGPAAGAPTGDTAQVGEIIVTAQRRSERLLSAPLSISVVDAARASNSGVVSTRNLGEIASGLTSTTNGAFFQPAIRGITTTGTTAGDESNIALYVDGVYMTAQAGNFFNLRNVERIEVLKGPQGTLFGRNATGGAIRVITSDPSLDTSVLDVQGNYGTKLNSIDLSGYASTPLSDKIAIGISASYYDDDGYVRNIIPGWNRGKLAQTRSYLGRAKLRLDLTDRLKIVLEGDYGYNKSDTAFVLTPIDRISLYKNTPGVILTDRPYEAAINLVPYIRTRGGGGSLTATLDLDDYTITSITARRFSHTFGVLDVDRVNLPLSNATTSSNYDWFTQELTVASQYDAPINFIGGLYYFYNNAFTPHSEAFSNGAIDATGFLTSFGTLGGAAQGHVKSNAYAAFTELTWKPAERFTVIGGLRYTTEKKDLETIRVQPALPSLTDSKRWSNVNYRITAQYNFSDATNIYFTHSTGFKAGQYQSSSAAFIQRVDPEKVAAEELGLKSRIASWLSGTVAGFYYKYDDIQVSSNNFINGANNIILANAAKATIYGVDADLFARAARGLTFQIGVSYLPRARYDSYTNALDSVPRGFPGSLNPALCPASPQCGAGNDQIIRTLTDSRMIRAPRFSGNIGATYETALAGGKLVMTGNYFHSSRFFWVAGEHIAEPNQDIVNGRITWTAPGGHYTVGLFGRNLTKDVYSIYNSPTAAGTTRSYAAPREIGLTAGVKF